MSVKIDSTTESSPAKSAGIRSGDELLTIDGSEIRDWLDFQYFASDIEHEFTFRRLEETFTVLLTRQWGEEFGLKLSEEKVRRCGNKCTFCFIDQNPKGLRRTLYVKDEDYRLSLTYGNYVTLTNLEEWEIERIIDQQLSPLYVSVHVTDPEARRRMIRSRHTDEILPLMRRLTEAGIRMHTQIVLVPEVNDGELLHRTLNDLESLIPRVETVAIVPVGLTRHRSKLPLLREFRSDEAAALIDEISARQSASLKARGNRIYFLADEFYLLAGEELPDAENYEDFPQIENGVGMIRRFENDLGGCDTLLTPNPDQEKSRSGKEEVILLTGTLFAPILKALIEPVLERTGEKGAFDFRIEAVQNRLFGSSVTVAGLLCGRDIIDSIRGQGGCDRVILSPEMFNTDGFTLDHLTVEEIAHQSQCAIQVDFNGRLVSGH